MRLTDQLGMQRDTHHHAASVGFLIQLIELVLDHLATMARRSAWACVKPTGFSASCAAARPDIKPRDRPASASLCAKRMGSLLIWGMSSHSFCLGVMATDISAAGSTMPSQGQHFSKNHHGGDRVSQGQRCARLFASPLKRAAAPCCHRYRSDRLGCQDRQIVRDQTVADFAKGGRYSAGPVIANGVIVRR